MTTLCSLSNLLVASLRSVTVTCARQRRGGLTRKVYGVYESNEQYEAEMKEKKLKAMKAKTRKPQQQSQAKERPPLDTGLKELRYENLRNDPHSRFANLMYNVKTSKYRDSQGVCVLHGKTAIKQAMESGCYVRCIYFSSFTQLETLPLDVLRKVNLFMVKQSVLDQFEDKQVEGIFALITKQDETTRKKIVEKRAENKEAVYVPLTLICAGIMDANVMGGILDVANVTGCEEVYVMESCVDIWDMATLKSGNGAHFNIPIHPELDWEKLERRMKNPHNLFIASDKPEEIKLLDFVGESRYQKIVEDSSLYREIAEETAKNVDEVDLVNTTIPSIPYHEMALSSCSNLILIGRLDQEAFRFCASLKAKGTNCEAVTLPMTSPAHKTTLLTSASVLLFEARRQVLARKEKE